MLYVHLCFAVSTPFLWGATIFLALKRFPNPPVPGPHSALHKKLGWLSVIDLVMTSVTGLAFYYMAFVRTA
jgi:putative membrane protein